MSFKNKIFHGFSAIALLICIYHGTKFMVSWLPRSLGTIGEYGDFVPLRETLAMCVSIFCGIPLLDVISRTAGKEVKYNESILLRVELDKLIEASDNENKLQSLRDELWRKGEEMKKYAEEKAKIDLKNYEYTNWIYKYPPRRIAQIYFELSQRADVLIENIKRRNGR